MLKEDYMIQQNDGVGSRSLPELFILVKLQGGQIYIFNQDTEGFWRLIEQGRTFGEVVEYFLQGEDSVSDDQAKELEGFILQLASLGLVKISTGEGESVPQATTSPLSQNSQYQDYCNQHNLIYFALIELTNHCNLQCVHCYQDEDKATLDLVHLTRVLGELKQMGTIEIVYTGGEIFLREDLLQILRLTTEMGFVVNFLTNGTLVTSEQIGELERIPFSNIKTSLYGSTAEVHDLITGVAGSFAATIQTMRGLRPLGRPITVNYVIMEGNFHQIEEAKVLVESFGAEISYDFKLFPTRTHSSEPLQQMVTDEKLVALFEKGVVPPLTEIRCLAGVSKVRIDPQGDIYPCEYLNTPLGNIAVDSLTDLWQSEKLEELRQRLDSYLPSDCQVCDRKEHCLRCPALVWNEQGKEYRNETHPVMCAQAEANWLGKCGASRNEISE